MTETPTIERPARRFLHICYSCADDTAVADFFVRGLDLQLVMRTSDVYSPGSILGLEGQVRSPRQLRVRLARTATQPGHRDPGLGRPPSPSACPRRIRTRSASRPSASRCPRSTGRWSVSRRSGAGVVADGKNPEALRQVAVRDPRDVTLDLVEDGDLDPGQTRLHHLRETVSDLEASIAFFDSLGFRAGRPDGIRGWKPSGAPRPAARGEVARLRLPDEPMELQLFAWTRACGVRVALRRALPRGGSTGPPSASTTHGHRTHISSLPAHASTALPWRSSSRARPFRTCGSRSFPIRTAFPTSSSSAPAPPFR